MSTGQAGEDQQIWVISEASNKSEHGVSSKPGPRNIGKSHIHYSVF